MNVPSPSAEELERILASLFTDLEHASDRRAIVSNYCERYPQYAEAIREASDLDQILGVSRGTIETPLPDRLGDFRIVRPIAKGGMGIICEAIQEPLNRRVAVKIIRRGATQATYRDRFMREQRVLARLHQTHIVPVFASGEEGQVQYFAMPYIDGAALHHVIQATMDWQLRLPGEKTPPLSRFVEMATSLQGHSETASWNENEPESPDSEEGPSASGGSDPGAGEGWLKDGDSLVLSLDYFRSVARVMCDVAESLEHAHRHGYVHRDVKPANIMVDSSGENWVIDFGLAGYVKDSVQPAVVSDIPEDHDALLRTRQVGTPGYWSPEQREGTPADQRTDVWGLGVTLYELLTLRPAFLSGLGNEKKGGKTDPGPVQTRQLVKNVPRDLDAICQKAIQVLPGDRYQTAQEFAEDIRRWLCREPTTVYPKDEPARTLRRFGLWACRNKGWASAIILFACFLVVVGGVQARHRTLSAARERDAIVLKVQGLLAIKHQNGWSEKAMDRVRQAERVSPDPSDQIVRNLAAATLKGLDVRCAKRFDGFVAEHLLFDPTGKRLLIGSTYSGQGTLRDPRIWNSTSDRVQELSGRGIGPFAFGPDGTPLCLSKQEGQLGLHQKKWTQK